MKKILRLLSGKGGKEERGAAAFYRDLTIDVLARTLWGEARGEGVAGMEAVACVILNRVAFAQMRGGYWWGTNIISVCQKPYQFSCWNRSDPNYRRVQAVTEKSDIHFATAVRIARRAIAGTLEDPTGAATHYHTRDILPDWARGQEPSAVIGRHMFYRLIES